MSQSIKLNKTIGRPVKYANEEERKEARRLASARCKSQPVYKEMVKIYNKNYYESHKDQRKEDYKKKNSVKITCEVCNKTLLKRNLKKHNETDRHKNNIV
jgi:hypothetical protein